MGRLQFVIQIHNKISFKSKNCDKQIYIDLHIFINLIFFTFNNENPHLKKMLIFCLCIIISAY